MSHHTDSRRDFMKFFAAALSATAVSGRSIRAAGAEIPRRFIIDSHQHYEEDPKYIERLLSVYTPRNAMACVNTFMSGFEVVKKAAGAHADVIIPYGRINVDDPKAPDEIDKFADAGFRGIKMHSPRQNWDDPQYFHLYAKLQERRLVALFHTGIAFHTETPQYTSMARMRPSYLDTLTRAFPNLYIQGAHLGNPWYDEAAEAARWGPKLYFDLTGSSLQKKEKNLAIFKDYLWWQGPSQHSSPHAVYAFEKLVFGTDEPPEHLPEVIARYEAMLNACDVPEASRRKIYGETMATILGVKVRA